MAKYEIMLILSGALEEKKAKAIANEIAAPISDCKPTVEEYGVKELAYKIKSDTHGYYFQYNFECEDPQKIFEFRRLSTINKYVLRNLIINLEKDYGYRATINPKKIKSNQIKAEIHARRKAEIERIKEARMQQFNNQQNKVDENLKVVEKQADEIVQQIEKKKVTRTRTKKEIKDVASVEGVEAKKTKTTKTTKKETIKKTKE